MADSMAFLIYQTMKKLINTIKNFYYQDPEGLIGSIAITLFFYFLLFHIIPIIKP
jgi:hypothetical protein